MVRICITNALAALGYRDDDVISELERRYESLSDVNVPRTMLESKYADVDEKVNIAAALYGLSNETERNRYLDFIKQWLEPPTADLSPGQLLGYWERRWMAVMCLEHMVGATSAIPRLEQMLTEENAQSWVAVHVPRVLSALQKQASP